MDQALTSAWTAKIAAPRFVSARPTTQLTPARFGRIIFFNIV